MIKILEFPYYGDLKKSEMGQKEIKLSKINKGINIRIQHTRIF